jgi:hypothetical protein
MRTASGALTPLSRIHVRHEVRDEKSMGLEDATAAQELAGNSAGHSAAMKS